MWKAEVLTLYPEVFPGVLGESVIGRGLRDGLWDLDVRNLRDYGLGEHRNVDGAPYGGGGGMVLRVDVIAKAVAECSVGFRRLYLGPRGRRVTQVDVEGWSKEAGIVFLSGHFGGVDQRVMDGCGFEEVSLCDFVLSGGEVACQAVIEGCVRLLDGVLGNEGSLVGESFGVGGGLQYDQYTRPEVWGGLGVPEVLLSGDHGRVKEWREESGEEITKKNRPDLRLRR